MSIWTVRLKTTRGEALFVAISVVAAALVTWYNWNARIMEGVFPHYLDFRAVILGGFDPRLATHGAPTFPMWGYGWLLIVTESKVLLVVFQQLLALLAAVVVTRHVAREPGGAFMAWALRALFVVVVPWYALHSVAWPYSPSVSLLTIALVLAHGSIARDASVRWGAVVLSGVIFGAALNFRSDAVLMPVGMAPALCLCAATPRRAIVRAVVWLASIYVCLVPWMLYTKHVTGHILVTSTNGGANLFEGLGQLPNNEWHIEASDGDPLMHRIVDDALGRHDWMAYVSYEGDQALKRGFQQRVVSHPRAYVRKCLSNLKQIFTSGCYAGEFYESSEPPVGLKGLLSERASPGSRALILYSFVLLPVTVVISLRRRTGFVIVAWLALFYQTTLNSIGTFLTSYSNFVLVFHLVNIAYALAWLVESPEPTRADSRPDDAHADPPVATASVAIPSSGARALDLRDRLRSWVTTAARGPGTSHSWSPSAVAGVALAIWGPSLIWSMCLLIPNLRWANYAGLACCAALAVALVRNARRPAKGIVCVILSLVGATIAVRASSIIATGVALAWPRRDRHAA